MSNFSTSTKAASSKSRRWKLYTSLQDCTAKGRKSLVAPQVYDDLYKNNGVFRIFPSAINMMHREMFWEIQMHKLLSYFALCRNAFRINYKKLPVAELIRIAERGDAAAQNQLGSMYSNGQSVAKHAMAAATWYEKAAEQGHADAQNNLGIMYETGRDVVKNEETAFAWYQKAAEQGHADALYRLGGQYFYGQGVVKDYEVAAFCFREAAEQGHAGAQYNLGIMYRDGQGVMKDERDAAFWHYKAAEQGHADAQYNLGFMYRDGQGVMKDERDATFWYHQAAQQGHADAQYNLGIMWRDGLGATKDIKMASVWYEKAAEQGHAGAQSELGAMYATGQGVVKRDIVVAYVLSNLAAASGNSKGRKNSEEFAVEMTRQQIEEGQTLLNNWQVGTPLPLRINSKYNQDMNFFIVSGDPAENRE